MKIIIILSTLFLVLMSCLGTRSLTVNQHVIVNSIVDSVTCVNHDGEQFSMVSELPDVVLQDSLIELNCNTIIAQALDERLSVFDFLELDTIYLTTKALNEKLFKMIRGDCAPDLYGYGSIINHFDEMYNDQGILSLQVCNEFVFSAVNTTCTYLCIDTQTGGFFKNSDVFKEDIQGLIERIDNKVHDEVAIAKSDLLASNEYEEESVNSYFKEWNALHVDTLPIEWCLTIKEGVIGIIFNCRDITGSLSVQFIYISDIFFSIEELSPYLQDKFVKRINI